MRDKPPDISGDWEQIWAAAGSGDFQKDLDRHSHTKIRQFGRYCYAEFYAKGIIYCFFARIQSSYLIGEWYDKNDPHAYFGAFELRIVDGSSLEGRYVGHSRRTCVVQQDEWVWKKR
ncbi:MAG: hypothetical protein JJE30_04045 [Desulfuromonadales bacterium]|nr:hypothetical protein [Desulfuromonadales bacterium]